MVFMGLIVGAGICFQASTATTPAIHCSALSHAAERRYAAGGFFETSQFHPSEKDYHAVFLGKKGEM